MTVLELTLLVFIIAVLGIRTVSDFPTLARWLLASGIIVLVVRHRSRSWRTFMRRHGLVSTRGLDSATDPKAVVEHVSKMEQAREEWRRDLLARAPNDPKAAQELQRLLATEISAFERTLNEIRRDKRVYSAIPEHLFPEWEGQLAELKRLRQTLAAYRLDA